MINITNIKLLMIIKYLIVECDYRIVYTQKTQNDIFLESIDGGDPPLIQLSFQELVFNNFSNDDILETKKIVNYIKRKTLKLKLETWVIALSNTQNKTPHQEKGLEFFNINFDNKKLNSKFPKIKEIWNDKNDVKETVESILKQIVNHSKQNLNSLKIKYGKRKIDSNKIFTMQLIWINFLAIFFANLFIPYSGIQSYPLIYSSLASSFETVFLHNQYWRLLISGFIGVNIIATLINIWIISMIGRIVSQMYGNIKYWFIVLLTVILTQLLVALSLPGSLIIGLDGIIFAFIGAIIYFAQVNRIFFINKFWKKLQIYLFILFVPMIIIGSWVVLAISLIAVSLGFISAMLVETFSRKKFLSFGTTLGLLVSVVGGFTYSWQIFPKRYPTLKIYDETYFKGYAFIFNDTGELQDKICDFYQLREENCSFVNYKRD